VSNTPPRAGSSRGSMLVFDNSASRRLVIDYFASISRPGASARRAARHAARRAARRRLLRLAQARRAAHCSSSTTLPRAGSSSTTSPTPRVRVPRHVARLVAPLVVDNSASRRLVVDYFASTARTGASAHRAARHVARRAACRRLLRLTQARHRLIRLRRASGCLSTPSGSSRRSSSTTPPRTGSSSTTSPPPRVRVSRHVTRLVSTTPPRAGSSRGSLLVVDYSTSRRLVVDYFAYAARLGASARRTARHEARRAAHRRLLRLAQDCVDYSASRRLVARVIARLRQLRLA
jgi:hypothetical protein